MSTPKLKLFEIFFADSSTSPLWRPVVESSSRRGSETLFAGGSRVNSEIAWHVVFFQRSLEWPAESYDKANEFSGPWSLVGCADGRLLRTPRAPWRPLRGAFWRFAASVAAPSSRMVSCNRQGITPFSPWFKSPIGHPRLGFDVFGDLPPPPAPPILGKDRLPLPMMERARFDYPSLRPVLLALTLAWISHQLES